MRGLQKWSGKGIRRSLRIMGAVGLHSRARQHSYLNPPREVNAGQAVKLRHYPQDIAARARWAKVKKG